MNIYNFGVLKNKYTTKNFIKNYNGRYSALFLQYRLRFLLRVADAYIVRPCGEFAEL